MVEQFGTQFGLWVIRRRWGLIIVTLLVVVFAGRGMFFLTFNNDNRVFFSPENPQLKALEALENTYTKENGVLFVIAAKDGNIFTRETLSAIEELTEKSWHIPYTIRVDSLTNYQHTEVSEDDLIVENLAKNAMQLNDVELRRIKKIALSEPLLLNRMISSAGDVTRIYANTLLPGKSVNEVTEVSDYVNKLAEAARKTHPGIDIYLTGGVLLNNAFGEASKKDMATLIPAMFLTLILIVGLSLRSFYATIATLFVILISTVTAMGVAGWLGISITAASVNAPTIILTLAVADSVHLLATMIRLIRQGKNRQKAIVEALRTNLQAVFLTSTTTAIGFLSMNFSDAPPFRDLGNIVAIGVSSAFFYSVLFLPALMAVFPLRIKIKQEDRPETHLNRLANFVIGWPKTILWISLLIGVALTTGISRIELNDNFIKYFDESNEIRRATDFMEAHLTGADLIEYALESGEESGINDPSYLTQVEAFANWYRTQPKVSHVLSITDIIKRLNQNMHENDPAYYRIPERRDLTAQYLLLYELSLPFGLDLNNQINVKKSATRMLVTVKDISTKELQILENNARRWLTENAPQQMFTYGSGLSVIWADLAQRNIYSMLKASFGALILISVILAFALKSLKLGLISLLPNLLPALMAFGIWGMFVGQVGLGLSVVVTMTLGIVVDDTIHFLNKYVRARREQNLDPAHAIRYAFNTVGPAMWVTTLALVAGFMVLTLSGYRMNADMGLMSALTITLALGMDFLLLPSVLLKLKA
ncbi:Predicted exporter of the RND superfamily [hydrothermal vent metagenome]|uniref:Predicted exporter of the RND superfamily n=1 Tax=hydrothermal vent metagenome TaxID=652676 RepID=A0A3B1CZ54_9ZZZZ